MLHGVKAVLPLQHERTRKKGVGTKWPLMRMLTVDWYLSYVKGYCNGTGIVLGRAWPKIVITCTQFLAMRDQEQLMDPSKASVRVSDH